MISKKELAYYNSLNQKKFRQLEKKFIADGEKVVAEALAAGALPEVILVSRSFDKDHPGENQKYIQKHIRFEVIRDEVFKKISGTITPQGIAAVLNFFPVKNPEEAAAEEIIIYLENISDPGNLGTILRICDWFGVKTVFLSEGTVEIYNPKVVRASMGSLFHLTVIENISLGQIGNFKKAGFTHLCTDTDGEIIYNLDLKEKLILTFSNESSGPSGALLKLADTKITIPGGGKAESLNVAAAAAVILSEVTRKKGSWSGEKKKIEV